MINEMRKSQAYRHFASNFVLLTLSNLSALHFSFHVHSETFNQSRKLSIFKVVNHRPVRIKICWNCKIKLSHIKTAATQKVVSVTVKTATPALRTVMANLRFEVNRLNAVFWNRLAPWTEHRIFYTGQGYTPFLNTTNYSVLTGLRHFSVLHHYYWLSVAWI